MFFFFQAEDGIRDAQESRGLGDVYKRQAYTSVYITLRRAICTSLYCSRTRNITTIYWTATHDRRHCLLYTSDAADEEDSVDLGGRRIIKKTRIATNQTETENDK
eukprot:TRINITY_DN63776_c0_g1_i1.p1 TRINITY_DN63776_c0_g1~~TRINITY_DN63776_c0_g1_i1.p1  ORF type:complete len:105 (+),score=26.39 TRINITY_DN63776_c0_g1_i1:58-372(+)